MTTATTAPAPTQPDPFGGGPENWSKADPRPLDVTDPGYVLPSDLELFEDPDYTAWMDGAEREAMERHGNSMRQEG